MIDIPYALASTAQVSSLSEGKRLVDQGGVEKVGGGKITSYKVLAENGDIIKAGKRRFFKVVID